MILWTADPRRKKQKRERQTDKNRHTGRPKDRQIDRHSQTKIRQADKDRRNETDRVLLPSYACSSLEAIFLTLLRCDHYVWHVRHGYESTQRRESSTTDSDSASSPACRDLPSLLKGAARDACLHPLRARQAVLEDIS